MTSQLRPRQQPRQRLAKTGMNGRLWPRPSVDWISDLVKVAADQAIATDGRRALQTVGHLVEQRRDLNETFTGALNQCLGLIGRLERREAQTSTVLDSVSQRFDQIDKAIADLSRQVEALRNLTPPPEQNKIFNEGLVEALVNGQGEMNRALATALDEIRELLQASIDNAERERENATPHAWDVR
ncbi:hypothetical protein VB780_26040 [Leptolyngbya sp. CCNP1308]|uniref:hypothetical protein n=1 Tax=Leptolyngbya sp. CCNP1308 TaxID=3110255 RepID=UPI002B21A21A|nr:hypothetical protein [Leptolyngbya sp. CCNP1308]MEA5452062.1 hypothetical protein [Leptolyngbya sp. CCNP1308]